MLFRQKRFVNLNKAIFYDENYCSRCPFSTAPSRKDKLFEMLKTLGKVDASAKMDEMFNNFAHSYRLVYINVKLSLMMVWFLCLMAYQLFLGYLMPKPFS